MHMVNDHDKMWEYEKNYSEALKDIQVNGNILEETKRIFTEEGYSIECKLFGKYFDILDQILGHIVTEHEELFRGNKFMLKAKFLHKNDFVDDEEDYSEYVDNPDEPLTEEIESNTSDQF